VASQSWRRGLHGQEQFAINDVTRTYRVFAVGTSRELEKDVLLSLSVDELVSKFASSGDRRLDLDSGSGQQSSDEVGRRTRAEGKGYGILCISYALYRPNIADFILLRHQNK